MITVLDVGVRGGPDPRWVPFAKEVQIVGIDADPDECTRLSRVPSPVSIRYLPYAVGRADGESATFYVCRNPGCSSLYPPHTAFLAHFPYGDQMQVLKTVPVTLTSLDTICATHGIQPDVIKLDTQGAELAIILGGRATLQVAIIVELEVEFNPQYLGQPLFGDVDAEMRRQGFILLGLKRSMWRRHYGGGSSRGGTIMHGDALYVRDPMSATDATRAAIALLAYGQDDFALTLSPARQTNMSRTLSQRMVGKLLATFGSHRMVRAWIDASRPPGARDWHDPDFF